MRCALVSKRSTYTAAGAQSQADNMACKDNMQPQMEVFGVFFI
jgi:hypothetical protein